MGSLLLQTVLTVCIACWCFDTIVSLECYFCAGNKVTLNGVENSDTVDVKNQLEAQFRILFPSQDADCLSSDPAVVEKFIGQDTCSQFEVCGYMDFTLINENYQGKGRLNITGVVRGCLPKTEDNTNECHNFHVSERDTDPFVALYFEQLSDTYGTGDHDTEPQEAFGCYCSDKDNCNIDYDTLNEKYSQNQDTAGKGVSVHNQITWIVLMGISCVKILHG